MEEEQTSVPRREFLIAIGVTYLAMGQAMPEPVSNNTGPSLASSDTVLDAVRKVLNRIRQGGDPTSYQSAQSVLYATDSALTAEALKHNLWYRTLRLIESRKVKGLEAWVWGHYYGLSPGFVWSSTELQRRSGVGRYGVESILDRVTEAIADTFRSGSGNPENVKLNVTDLEEGIAGTIALAIAEAHPHVDEVRRGAEMVLQECFPASFDAIMRRNLQADEQKRKLKTSRYLPSVRASALSSAYASAVRSLTDSKSHRTKAVLPLWTPADRRYDDLEAVLFCLKSNHGTAHRETVYEALQSGHHLLLHGTVDADLLTDFLMFEVSIMRDHYNISGIATLDLLEHLLPMNDPRRVTIARERAHLLQVHHYRAASVRWLEIANKRVLSPSIKWRSRDDRLIDVARNIERLTQISAELNAIYPDAPRRDLTSLQSRIRNILSQVEDIDRTTEWSHIADRRAIESKLWSKIADSRNRLDANWDDDELCELERIDESVGRLSIPIRELGWLTRRLSILLAANRPADFVATSVRSIEIASSLGVAYPNQVSRLVSTLKEAAANRRQSWLPYRLEISQLLSLLPRDTDSGLRDQLALPRYHSIGGVPLV